MFDIFEDVEQPKLYIVDMEISAKIPSRTKKVKYETLIIKLKNNPLTMVNGKVPTQKSEQKLFFSIYNSHIKKNDFNKIIFKIESISNIRFSSLLMYKFDYLIH
jgi:hypothetical protein